MARVTQDDNNQPRPRYRPRARYKTLAADGTERLASLWRVLAILAGSLVGMGVARAIVETLIARAH